MKFSLLIMIFALQTTCIFSQVKSGDTTFRIAYHKNKKISTKEVVLKDNIYWGYAKAFDKTGKQIYNMQTRSVGGHASVHFAYYEDGAVRMAHYTSHPDGGIQWSDIKHHFDNDGNVVNVEDFSSDIFGRPSTITILKETQPEEYVHPALSPDINPKPVEETLVIKPKMEPEVMRCAEIYQSEVYLVNLTGRKQNISSRSKNRKIEQEATNAIVGKKDTLKVGTFIEAQMYTHPKEFMEFIIHPTQKNMRFLWDDFVQEGKAKRKYYVVLVSTK
jgi:hypothetical protein